MHKTIPLFGILLCCLYGCNQHIPKEEARKISHESCARKPDYIQNTPIPPQFAALTTSDKRKTGLALINISNGEIWQHPSWSKYGHLGIIATDEMGHSYLSAIPVINVLHNQHQSQNTLFKVNAATGQMDSFMSLPTKFKTSDKNPYGVVGLHYDCHARILFASSIMGSDDKVENGILYIIDPEKHEIIDELTNTDILGMATSGVTGEKRLYFGKARTSEVYSIEIGKNNKFIGEPVFEFTLEMLGPKGDDKAKKIQFMQDGSMLVKGVAFNYNLTAPTEIHETKHQFYFDRTSKKWLYKGMLM